MSTSRWLTVGVAVRHPDSGTPKFLPVGSELPGWAHGLVGDHALTDGPPPEDSAAEGSGGEEWRLPPKAGPGSSRARWLAYAEINGVSIDEDATRDDIIAACQSVGVPTG